MVKYYYNNLKLKQLKILDEFKKGCWVYVENPTARELEALAQNLELEEDLLRDATDIYEAPRMEREGDKTYIFTRYAHSDGGTITTMPVLTVISDEFILTFSNTPLPFLKKFTDGGIRFQTALRLNLLLQLLLQVNQTYTSYLNNVQKRVRALSAKLENIDNKDLIQFVSYETVLNDFLSGLVPASTIFNNLLSGRFLKFSEDDKDLVEDLLLGNNQLIELTRANLRTIVNIREAYSTIMTNNLNRVIKLFTSITVILTIPTMIASIFGMNVDFPFSTSWPTFIAIIAFIVFISTGLVYIFNRRHWL